MSAHRALNDIFRAFDSAGPGILNDPGSGGTITFSMWGQQCLVTTAAAEARTLARPTKPGILASVVLDADGGDLTLTVTGGYNIDGDTSITFDDAGDMVVFMSVKTSTTYQWQAIAQEGTNVALETAEFDAIITGAITGGDSSLGITGQAGTTGAGGALAITGGAGSATASNGGAITVTGGVSGAGATGTGGAITITGGGNTNATNGAGGPVTVAGGTGKGTGAGGALSLQGGGSAGASSGTTGAAQLTSGIPGTVATGATGTTTVESADAYAASGAASGAVTLRSGAGGTHATAGGAGGAVAITGGAGGAATSGTGGAGASVTITGGVGGADSGSTQGGAGGDIFLTPGAGGASGGTAGAPGIVNVTDGKALFLGPKTLPATTVGGNWIGFEDSGVDPSGTVANSVILYPQSSGDDLDALHADGTTEAILT